MYNYLHPKDCQLYGMNVSTVYAFLWNYFVIKDEEANVQIVS